MGLTSDPSWFSEIFQVLLYSNVPNLAKTYYEAWYFGNYGQFFSEIVNWVLIHLKRLFCVLYADDFDYYTIICLSILLHFGSRRPTMSCFQLSNFQSRVSQVHHRWRCFLCLCPYLNYCLAIELIDLWLISSGNQNYAGHLCFYLSCQGCSLIPRFLQRVANSNDFLSGFWYFVFWNQRVILLELAHLLQHFWDSVNHWFLILPNVCLFASSRKMLKRVLLISGTYQHLHSTYSSSWYLFSRTPVISYTTYWTSSPGRDQPYHWRTR